MIHCGDMREVLFNQETVEQGHEWNERTNDTNIYDTDKSRQKKQSNKCRGSEVEACWLYSQRNRDTREARAMWVREKGRKYDQKALGFRGVFRAPLWNLDLILSELEDFEQKRHDHEHRGDMSLKYHWFLCTNRDELEDTPEIQGWGTNSSNWLDAVEDVESDPDYR